MSRSTYERRPGYDEEQRFEAGVPLKEDPDKYKILEAGEFTAGVKDPSFVATVIPDAQTEKLLRLGFIRKVYGILSIQLLLTFAVSAVCVLSDTVREGILDNVWTVYVGFIFSIGLLIGLLMFRDRYPTNMYLLAAWTLVEAYTVGVVCAAYASQGQGTIVVQAAGLTLAVFLGLTIFTFQSKIDFSFLGGALFAGLWILLLWGLVMAIFGFKQSYLYSLGGAVLFSLYILYDTSLLLYKLALDNFTLSMTACVGYDWERLVWPITEYDEYILASISLYLDIINLFLYILRLLARNNR